MNKRLSVNIIASLTSFFIGIGINFFLSPYIIENVGTEAYGFVGLANNFISYASLFTLALNSMAGRFITIQIHRKSKYKTQIYFNSVLIANVFMAIIIAVLSFVIIWNLNSLISVTPKLLKEVQVLFGLLFANMVITLLSTVFTVSLFATNRLDLKAKRDIEANLIRVAILVVLFLIFKPSITYLGIGALASGVYITITGIYYTKKLLPDIEFHIKYFSFKVVKEIIASGMWNVFTKLGGIMANGLDLLITNIFVDAIFMGILSISKIIPTLILSLFGTLAGTFAPNLTMSYANNDMTAMEQQLLQAIKILAIIACIPLAILVAFGDVFYQLWIPSENANLLHILSILAALELLFAMPLEPLWNIFTITNKLKVSSLVIFIGSFISLTIVLIVLPVTEDLTVRLYIIAGVSTFIAILRNLFFLPLYGAKCLGLKWYIFYPVIFKNTLTFIIVVGTVISFKHYFPISWLSLVIMSGIIVILAIVINYFLILSKQERIVVTNFFKSKIKK